MKKVASAIPVAAMFGILAFFFVYMCLPEEQNAAAAVYMVDLNYLRTRGLYCVGVGVVLMAALYHLTLFILRPREKIYLIFSLWCIQLVVHFVFAQNGFNGIFQWVPAGTFFTWLDNLSFFLRHYTLCIFALYLFSRSFLLSHKTIWIAYFVLGVATFSFVPVSVPFFIPVVSLVIIAVSLFPTVIAFRFPKWKENVWTLSSFVALSLHTFGGILDILINPDGFFMLKLLFNLFLILSQSLVLSQNYTNAFALAEETNQNLEQIVDERTKKLQATNTAMKELVSNISHDLKTPLAVLSLNLETLSGLAVTQSDADYRRHVRTAYQKNLDLQRLIQNLFEVSRIETDRSLYMPEWESLLRLLVQAREKYDDFLEDNGIQLDIDVASDTQISTDPQKIWNVFDNIIYNAARHTESGGNIKIAVHSAEASAAVTITDTGCGIAPEHLPHIFERFYKGSKARGEKEGDSGLGLYIVKSVMEGCGGSVKAESELGKGTSIILTFPAHG